MFFFPGGYCGLAPIEDGLYNACCLVHRHLTRIPGCGCPTDFSEWLRTLARHPALEARLRGAIQVSPTLTTAPVRSARRRPDESGALLAGDAAGFLDPFTGDGISMALHAGRLAAKTLAESLSGANGSAVTDGAALVYRRRLRAAVQRSYAIAGFVRLLVRAPEELQEAAARAVPWLGKRLVAATRWRDEGH
jgi:flavin-dependent dehydrogenase